MAASTATPARPPGRFTRAFALVGVTRVCQKVSRHQRLDRLCGLLRRQSPAAVVLDDGIAPGEDKSFVAIV
jgi:hypothetical protein